MLLVPDKLISWIYSFFSRSAEDAGDKNKASNGTAQYAAEHGSHLHLPENDAFFKFQRKSNSSHGECEDESREEA